MTYSGGVARIVFVISKCPCPPSSSALPVRAFFLKRRPARRLDVCAGLFGVGDGSRSRREGAPPASLLGCRLIEAARMLSVEVRC